MIEDEGKTVARRVCSSRGISYALPPLPRPRSGMTVVMTIDEIQDTVESKTQFGSTDLSIGPPSASHPLSSHYGFAGHDIGSEDVRYGRELAA